MDGLRDDHEQAVGDEEQEVQAQEHSEEQEVGDHSSSETSTQSLRGQLPQMEGTEDAVAAEEAVTPSLGGEKPERLNDA